MLQNLTPRRAFGLRGRRFLLQCLVPAALACGVIACGDEVNVPTSEQGPGSDQGKALAVAAGEVFYPPTTFIEKAAAGALVLDVRGAEDYAAGHLAGAVNVDWKAFAIPERNGIVIEDVEQLQTIARGLGLRDGQTVLIYGGWGGDASSAGRLFWTLEYLGHDDVHLLEGDLAALEAAGGTVDTAPVTPTPGDFTVERREQIRSTFTEVVEAVQADNFVIVDTRTPEEFEGTELRGNPRGGHIPSAVHLEWTRVFDEAGNLRPDAELRSLVEGAGIVDGRLVIAYCQSGVRSSFFYAVLRRLGYANPQNYDGSSWEWSRAVDVEIETE